LQACFPIGGGIPSLPIIRTVEVGAEEYKACETVTLTTPSDKNADPLVFKKLTGTGDPNEVLAYTEVGHVVGGANKAGISRGYQNAHRFLYYSAFTEEWRVGTELPKSNFDAATISMALYTMSVSTLEAFPEQIGLKRWRVFDIEKHSWQHAAWKVTSSCRRRLRRRLMRDERASRSSRQ
jgi:hypothetical protein